MSKRHGLFVVISVTQTARQCKKKNVDNNASTSIHTNKLCITLLSTNAPNLQASRLSARFNDRANVCIGSPRCIAIIIGGNNHSSASGS